MAISNEESTEAKKPDSALGVATLSGDNSYNHFAFEMVGKVNALAGEISTIDGLSEQHKLTRITDALKVFNKGSAGGVVAVLPRDVGFVLYFHVSGRDFSLDIGHTLANVLEWRGGNRGHSPVSYRKQRCGIYRRILWGFRGKSVFGFTPAVCWLCGVECSTGGFLPIAQVNRLATAGGQGETWLSHTCDTNCFGRSGGLGGECGSAAPSAPDQG